MSIRKNNLIKFHKLPIIFVIIVSMLSLTACNNFNSPSEIKDRGELIIATNAEFNPFTYMNDKKETGIDIDIAGVIARNLGVKLKVENMAYDTILTAVSIDKADIGIGGIILNEKISNEAEVSNPYFDTSIVILVKENNTKIINKKTLKGDIGVIKGTVADKLLTGTKDVNIIRAKSETDLINDLNKDTTDAVIMDESKALEYLSKNKEKIKILSEKYSDDEFVIIVKKGNTDLIKIVNRAINEIILTGKYDKIMKKYGLTE